MVGPMDEGTLDALLREAAAWRLERALSSLPGEEELRAARGALTRLDRRVARGAAALRRRQRIREERNLPRMSWRRLRRILVVAALLAALAVGTLTVSAELRLAVKNTLVEWGQRNMSIRYEVEGHPLTALCSRIQSIRISGRLTTGKVRRGWVPLRTATDICFLGLRVVLNTICISMLIYRSPKCSESRTIFIKDN